MTGQSFSYMSALLRDLNRHHAAALIQEIDRRPKACSSCDHVLAIAEVVEKYCAACGDIEPCEVRA